MFTESLPALTIRLPEIGYQLLHAITQLAHLAPAAVKPAVSAVPGRRVQQIRDNGILLLMHLMRMAKIVAAGT